MVTGIRVGRMAAQRVGPLQHGCSDLSLQVLQVHDGPPRADAMPVWPRPGHAPMQRGTWRQLGLAQLALLLASGAAAVLRLRVQSPGLVGKVAGVTVRPGRAPANAWTGGTSTPTEARTLQGTVGMAVRGPSRQATGGCLSIQGPSPRRRASMVRGGGVTESGWPQLAQTHCALLACRPIRQGLRPLVAAGRTSLAALSRHA